MQAESRLGTQSNTALEQVIFKFAAREHFQREAKNPKDKTQQGPDGGEPFRAEMRNCCKSRTPKALALARNLSGRDDIYVDFAGASFGLEVNHSVNQGEEGVVSSAAYVFAGMQFGSALTDEDVAREDSLATEAFYAASLTV